MSPREAPSRFGIGLTPETSISLPIRICSYLGQGRAEGVVADEDTVVLWSGGRSDVTMVARHAGGACSEGRTLRFTRKSGMIDFLPRGTVLDKIVWRGEACGCVAVELERNRVQRLLGVPVPAFDAERGFRTNVVDAHVVDLVRRLEAQAIQGNPFGTRYVEALSLTLASYVYGRYSGADRRNGETQLPMSETERLVTFVENNLGADIGLADLARIAGHSPDYVSRTFKRSFGVSLYQYVLRRRVERATALLRDRRHSIAEIALTCGFSTQSHFSAMFKGKTGMTPGAYRRG
jgi:AraC family transcriptional regulator